MNTGFDAEKSHQEIRRLARPIVDAVCMTVFIDRSSEPAALLPDDDQVQKLRYAADHASRQVLKANPDINLPVLCDKVFGMLVAETFEQQKILSESWGYRKQ